VTHDELVAELTRRYPHGTMPAGAGLALAREVGVELHEVGEARRASGIRITAGPKVSRRRPRPRVRAEPPARPSRTLEALAELERRCDEHKCVEPGSFRSIAELLGVSPGWVGKVAKDHGYIVISRDWRSALKPGRVLP
jgi:hypothetical protein